jgi:Domain of unknown function (DUF4185)
LRSRRPEAVSGVARSAGLAMTLLVSACAPGALRTPPPGQGTPYPQSRTISAVTWDFAALVPQRKARGSDLWPCAWALDGDLYCAWGDGGGFDGDDDNIGRASLGFARIKGIPSLDDARAIAGKNIWGSPPYAEFAARFGGKVGSMISVDGVLYAIGGFWRPADSQDPVLAGGRGPFSSIAWSTDLARSWQIAPWSSSMPLGSFLDMGQDSANAVRPYVMLYYQRAGDSRHVYLKRIAPKRLIDDPAATRSYEYFTGVSRILRRARWSSREADAAPVFADGNNVSGPSAVYDAGLGRYLLTAGHYASGDDNDSSAGQVGIFEAPNPWGPWATVGYYENWGNLKAETAGDYLSLRIPSKWISADGRTLWAVFSGLKSFDSFNVVRAVLSDASRH